MGGLSRDKIWIENDSLCEVIPERSMDGTMDRQQESLDQFSVHNHPILATIESSQNPRDRIGRRMMQLNQTTALLTKKVTGVNFYLKDLKEKNSKLKAGCSQLNKKA
jgi:hypothetical protein